VSVRPKPLTVPLGTMPPQLELFFRELVERVDRLPFLYQPTSETPADATATGPKGKITWDGTYIYVWVADDTVKRALLSTWP
jgi:hypothetical protein